MPTTELPTMPQLGEGVRGCAALMRPVLHVLGPGLRAGRGLLLSKSRKRREGKHHGAKLHWERTRASSPRPPCNAPLPAPCPVSPRLPSCALGQRLGAFPASR